MAQKSAWTVINELRLSGELSDALIEVDGVKFAAHKIILCGCSSYFRALFSSDWSEPGRREYTIPGVSPEIMRLVIHYAYTYSVPVTIQNVQSLLVAADQFNIQGIVKCCSDFLETQLSPENCIGICNFANINSCPELHQSASHFILQNFREVASISEEFLELTISQLCDIIERDELIVSQEEVVFNAILRWIQHAPSSRNAQMSVLLSKVRMALMRPDFFKGTVMNNSLLKDRVEYHPIFISTLKSLNDVNMNGPSPSDFQNLLTRPRLPSAILLAISGWSNAGPTRGIEAYDIRANRWLNLTKMNKGPRECHKAAFLKGYVYCIGGFDGVNCLNCVDRFNPITQTWCQVSEMHRRRHYVSVAVLDGFIYAMGGFDGYERLNSAERYNPKKNRWSLISPMTEKRSDAGAATLHGKVYICGGCSGSECLLTAECYNPVTNQWHAITPMTTPRSGVGVTTYNDQIYAVGGFDGSDRLRTVEAYNPVTNSWRDVAARISPRSHFGIEVVENLLFVAGGFNGLTTTSTVEYYNANTDSWCNAQNMGISRSALSCCVVPAHPSITQYPPPSLDPDSHPRGDKTIFLKQPVL